MIYNLMDMVLRTVNYSKGEKIYIYQLVKLDVLKLNEAIK